MPRPDGRITPGQPLRNAISAQAWNRAQDAADIVLGKMIGAAGSGASAFVGPTISALCRNNSGQDLIAGTAKFVTGVELPTDEQMLAAWSTLAPWNSQELIDKYGDTAFVSQPIITLGEAGDSKTKAWGVALEPIKGGDIGRVAFCGVVAVRLIVEKESDRFATLYYNNYYLHSQPYGQAYILWRSEIWESQAEDSSRFAFAYVQLGGGHTRIAVGTVISGCGLGGTCTVQLDYGDGGDEVDVKNKIFETIDAGVRVAVGSFSDGWLVISKDFPPPPPAAPAG